MQTKRIRDGDGGKRESDKQKETVREANKIERERSKQASRQSEKGDELG